MPFEAKDFGTPIMLTLHRRADRFDAAMKRVRAVDDWPFEMPRPFYGVDGRVKGFDPPPWIANEINQTLSPGGWGCQLSFVNIVAEFLESGDPWRVILEDDVWLVDRFGQKVNDYLAKVPDDADCIYVGGNPRSTRQYYPVEINELVCRPWRITATHFCIFNRHFAADLSKWLLAIPIEQMDAKIARLHSISDPGNKAHGGKYNVYFPRYDLAGQVMGQSDIQVLDAPTVQPMIWGVTDRCKFKPLGSDVTERVGGPLHPKEAA